MKSKILCFLVGGLLSLAMPAFAANGGSEGGSAPYPSAMGAVSESNTSAEALFGGRKGHIHPFLSVGESYTDNLFNNRSREDELITVITPGIWLALPGSRQQVLQITTLNSAPGGLEVSRFQTETGRRFQSYALYRANIEKHKRFPQEDSVYQRGEGLLNFNFRGGLSIELMDIFEKDHDPFGTGTSVKLDKFRSNLFHSLISYRLSPKTKVRVDYSNYTLSFDADRNKFRNRDDNMVSGYFFYHALPKTSFFIEYDFIDVNYETDILNGSTEQHFLGGIQWNITEKTRGQMKLGISKKKFTGNGGDTNDFLAEVRLDYLVSPKTSLYLIGTRKPIETDIQGTKDILSYRVQVGYSQRFTAKVNGNANLYYHRDRYQGNLTIGSQTGERKDEYYGAGLGFGYAMKPWLNLGLEYDYIQRDSNFQSYDYRTNTVFLSITAAI